MNDEKPLNGMAARQIDRKAFAARLKRPFRDQAFEQFGQELNTIAEGAWDTEVADNALT